MADYQVIFHPAAREELLAARRWYADRDETAAVLFAREVDRAVNAVAAAPDRWPLHVHGTRRYVLRRFPYLLVYRLLGDQIQVIAVAHGRRRPDYWRHR